MEAQQDNGAGHRPAWRRDEERDVGPVELDLPGATSAVTTARAAVRDILFRWGYRDEACVQLAELITGELVANAVRHAGGTSTLTVSADRSTVTLTVTDESPVPPAPRPPDDTGGRGLMIVEAITTSWGYVEHPGDGKTVWARLAAAPTDASP
jgi:anti-sigma regulatory factor (Ser/Thr protein kinase)